jgi:hypothetical protein
LKPNIDPKIGSTLMSGGYIKPQRKGDHQVVHFTFAGPIEGKHADKWNKSLAEFKALFGHNLTGITIKGDKTPPKYGRLVAKHSKKSKR